MDDTACGPARRQNYTAVDTYANGALVLDFVDTRTRKLVFRGVGRGVVGET